MKTIKILALVAIALSANLSFAQSSRAPQQGRAAAGAETGQVADEEVLRRCCSGEAQCNADDPAIKGAVERVLGGAAGTTGTTTAR